MATLAEQLQGLVQEHSLTSLSINVFNHTGIDPYFYSYAHGDEMVGTASSECGSPAEAITNAIADLNRKRHFQPAVPELAAA